MHPEAWEVYSALVADYIKKAGEFMMIRRIWIGQ
jgi:hypothetical protein